MTYNPVPSGFLSCVGWFSPAFQSLGDILSSGFSFCELAQVVPVFLGWSVPWQHLRTPRTAARVREKLVLSLGASQLCRLCDLSNTALYVSQVNFFSF